MKKFNLLYLTLIPMFYFWFVLHTNLSKTTFFFYGFAENKETELSQDKDISVQRIFVTPGQEVLEGDLLMEVQQTQINYKIESLDHELLQVNLDSKAQTISIQNKLEQLKINKQTIKLKLNDEIKLLKNKMKLQADLINGLGSMTEHERADGPTSNEVKLSLLEKRLFSDLITIDNQIRQLEETLAGINKPRVVQKNRLKDERKYYEEELNKLKIYAPCDGIIGNILCKVGENISAFSTLINFYERRPTIVKGYVHESQILKISKNDSLLVSSSLHNTQPVKGMIIGLGSRIVEIPERLRKIPELKTYGREVLIKISEQNPFLQKEKVMLNAIFEDDVNTDKLELTHFTQ